VFTHGGRRLAVLFGNFLGRKARSRPGEADLAFESWLASGSGGSCDSDVCSQRMPVRADWSGRRLKGRSRLPKLIEGVSCADGSEVVAVPPSNLADRSAQPSNSSIARRAMPAISLRPMQLI